MPQLIAQNLPAQPGNAADQSHKAANGGLLRFSRRSSGSRFPELPAKMPKVSGDFIE
jgi:hypothetical protein